MTPVSPNVGLNHNFAVWQDYSFFGSTWKRILARSTPPPANALSRFPVLQLVIRRRRRIRSFGQLPLNWYSALRTNNSQGQQRKIVLVETVADVEDIGESCARRQFFAPPPVSSLCCQEEVHSA